MPGYLYRMKAVIELYVSLMPMILAGIANMLWVRVGPRGLRVPLDGGYRWRDGRPIFGPHKTWLGVVGYLGLGLIFTVLWGLINARLPALARHNLFYVGRANTVGFNAVIGLLLGLAYSLFELPNSFLKRRIGIDSGGDARGPRRLIFATLDQADSVIGCVLVLALFYPLGLGRILLYIAIGAATHLVLNALLYLVGLRSSPL